MADGTPGKSRRIWTRCPYCNDVVDMPSNHLDSFNKGCRRSLEESGEKKKSVIEKMRDEAYAFTAKQTIRPFDLENILRSRAAGPEARACMLDLLAKLNIKVSHKSAVAPPPVLPSSSDDESQKSDTERGKEAPDRRSVDDGAAANAPGDSAASNAQGDAAVSKTHGAAPNAQGDAAVSKTHDSEVVTADLRKLEVCSPNTVQQARKHKPSMPSTPKCKVHLVRSPEIDKVGLSYVTGAPKCGRHI